MSLGLVLELLKSKVWTVLMKLVNEYNDIEGLKEFKIEEVYEVRN